MYTDKVKDEHVICTRTNTWPITLQLKETSAKFDYNDWFTVNLAQFQAIVCLNPLGSPNNLDVTTLNIGSTWSLSMETGQSFSQDELGRSNNRLFVLPIDLNRSFTTTDGVNTFHFLILRLGSNDISSPEDNGTLEFLSRGSNIEIRILIWPGPTGQPWIAHAASLKEFGYCINGRISNHRAT